MSESYDDDMVTLDVTPFLSNSLGHRRPTYTDNSWYDSATNAVSSTCSTVMQFPMMFLNMLSNATRPIWGMCYNPDNQQ